MTLFLDYILIFLLAWWKNALNIIKSVKHSVDFELLIFGSEKKQFTDQEFLDYIRNAKTDIKTAKQYRFVIDLSDKPIGFIDLFDYDIISAGVGIIIIKKFRNKGFAKEALNLIDNLERSKVALENDEKLKNTDALKKITEHLDIINNDMLSIFKKNNIEPIKSINEKLDPNLHQAMMEVEDDTKDPGTIVQEIQKGFMMKDRLLRPSLVGVSKKKAKEVEKAEKKDDNNQ